MNILYMIVAALLGAVLTTQIATNKQLGEHLHNLYIPAFAKHGVRRRRHARADVGAQQGLPLGAE